MLSHFSLVEDKKKVLLVLVKSKTQAECWGHGETDMQNPLEIQIRKCRSMHPPAVVTFKGEESIWTVPPWWPLDTSTWAIERKARNQHLFPSKVWHETQALSTRELQSEMEMHTTASGGRFLAKQLMLGEVFEDWEAETSCSEDFSFWTQNGTGLVLWQKLKGH